MNKLEHNAAALKRWRTRLKRAITMIDKLEKQHNRLLKAYYKNAEVAQPVEHRAESPVLSVTPTLTPKPLVQPPPSDDLGIPEFLRRGAAAQEAADKVIADHIREEQAETKKQKARGRVEKMKAKQRGDLKKMPLTGRAALEAIRNT
jgi:hypothetical protein